MRDIYKVKMIDKTTLQEVGELLPFSSVKPGDVVTVYKSNGEKVPHYKPEYPYQNKFYILLVYAIEFDINKNITLVTVPYITDDGYAADAYPIITI